MLTAAAIPAYCLRTPPDGQRLKILDSGVEDEAEEKTSDEEEYLLCRQCLHVITSSAERIAVQGSHRHTFANPHGIVFEIGCFRSVPGCGYAGPAADEFTWFAGFSWRVAVCIRCLTHLGWLFASAGYDSFHGLILDRLVTQNQ
ncbi:MAG: cereblon family protein [Pseudomonadota bacterium]|uniref:CULT domain-containing protein n=1 Tax=Candidatus Desulfatibia profunda TaxID=2841695 RepID=A0A8J6NRY0_9BACT|nr:hypothetical protein [Candidatus Desulfatibia profunda]MBL7179988.1 hypothetical protein [Desulfobacterales bacterium]